MPRGAYEFETERLALRVWREAHRAPFAEMNADPEVMRYFPALISREQSDASVDYWLALFAERGFGMWAVELRATGESLGLLGYRFRGRCCRSGRVWKSGGG